MIELFKRLLQQHEEEEIFIEYLKKLRTDIHTLKKWANEVTEESNTIKERLDLFECKQIEDREDTTEQLERIESRLDKLEEKKK